VFIADFHIHSKYSRATSKDCIPEMLELWARRKGLDLIGTGDFTHPAWREELKEKLVPSEEGLYALKDDFRREDNVSGENIKPRFIVSGEISSIYKKNGKVRKVHNLILLPSLEDSEALSHRLEAIGNLHSDGRPILGLDSRDLLEITLEACHNAIFIPAHIWTPHFSVFGAYSGFDDIQECFEDLTSYIHALETGLSSDPPMNWRLSALDKFTLVSNSDAHSPANLAREANLFDTILSYPHISRALQNRDTKEFYGTLEFFPEEGKYHYDGHRNCKVCLKPADTRDAGGICSVCGGKITVGVLHRVEALADRSEGFVPPAAKHFESLIPLHEVIAASTGVTTASIKVKEKYDDLIHDLGSELFILRQAQLGDIDLKAGPLVAEGIRRLRYGKVEVLPGYDGEFGKIKILDKAEIDRISGQLGFFNEKQKKARKPVDNQKQTIQATEAPAQRSLMDIRLPEKGTDTTQVVSRDAFYGLNREQWEAVSSSDPVIAVIAGPGTGKTRTLVSRIAYLTQERGVPSAQIMAVTFTNRAAHEMRARLTQQFENISLAKETTIGTFHSICLKILSGQNGGSTITVIDEYDALSILEDILKSLHLKDSSRNVLKAISLIKSGAQPAGEKTDVPPGVYDLYCAQLERYGVLDYDDILLNTLRLLEDRSTGSPENQISFSHLLVDEFQDINATQYRLIKEWGKNSAGIFVIGDPDQSIYGFRGSDARCFNRLLEDFPRMRQVRLTHNYRSTPEIVRCSQSLILKQNAGGYAHSLEAKRASGTRVRLLEAHDEFSEALFVTKEINRMVGGIDMLDAHKSPLQDRKSSIAGTVRGFSDIAVLYRTNHQAEILEQCFLQEGIPYVVVGRDEFLFDREVRQTLAFFRFMLNPADLVALGLCLKTMAVCQTGNLHQVLEDYAASEKNLSSLSEVIKRQPFTSSADNPLNLLVLLPKYAPLVRQENPQRLIESWINDNGLKDVQCMERLLNMAVLHDGMPSFLQNILLGRESDLVRSGRRSYSPDAVSLMTLHGAKGLEFPVVFLCGIKDGLIPLQNREGDCNFDEERRLFYVGMTRAQDELILMATGPQSPFLAEIPAASLSIEKAFAGKKALDFEQLSLFNARLMTP
jgi:uncharacterized protein (TIGR00375 family)